MKLAFCLLNYFPYGGLQRDFYRIAKLCHQRGHQIDVYTLDWQGPKPDWLNLFLIKKEGVTNHSQAKHFANFLTKKLARANYDRIIGFNKLPGLDFYFAADGCFVAQSKYKNPLLRLLPRYRIYAALEKTVFAKENNTQILLISQLEQENYQRYYHTPSLRLHLLPPGVSKDRIRPLDAATICENYRQTLQVGCDDFILLIVASRFHTKGVDRAILALANLPISIKSKTKLWIVGDDSSKQYHTLISQHGLEKIVSFLGARDDIPALLFTADLLIHPARRENTGTVLVEAIAAGLPVLTNACCGYAHYVTDAKAGLVIAEPFLQSDLDHALYDMLDKKRLNTYQENAIAYARQHDLYSLIEKAADIITSTHQLS